MYDLVRLALSLRVSTGFLRSQVRQHCEMLGCEITDARSYLAAALGHLGGNLGHFPSDRFVKMAKSCFAKLEEVL